MTVAEAREIMDAHAFRGRLEPELIEALYVASAALEADGVARAERDQAIQQLLGCDEERTHWNQEAERLRARLIGLGHEPEEVA